MESVEGAAVETSRRTNGEDTEESELWEFLKPSGDGAVGGGCSSAPEVGVLGPRLEGCEPKNNTSPEGSRLACLGAPRTSLEFLVGVRADLRRFRPPTSLSGAAALGALCGALGKLP